MNSNSVTIPKFPPPPRTAQNRSECSCSEARSIRPSAVTISTATRLSDDRPASRDNQPNPPPSVRPGHTVLLMNPPGTARPCAWVTASNSPHVVPPPHRTRRFLGSTLDGLHRGEVDHEATVGTTSEPGVVVTATTHGDVESLLHGRRPGRRRRRRSCDIRPPPRGGGGSRRSRS